MKRSSVVGLALSGALLTGCNPSDDASGWEQTPTYTNNTHVAGRGYYHAPYQAWYPFPYNYFALGRGYYHGGGYSPEPHVSGITASKPLRTTPSSHVRRGGFSSSRSGIS